VGCWHGYLSGARCRLSCDPADATATHCLSGTSAPGVVPERAVKCVYIVECFEEARCSAFDTVSLVAVNGVSWLQVVPENSEVVVFLSSGAFVVNNL